MKQLEQIQNELSKLTHTELAALALALINEFYLGQWIESKGAIIQSIKELSKELQNDKSNK